MCIRDSSRGASVDLLHVDPGVVAPLDRGDDDAGARSIEKRERRRLVAARVLVGVIPHDRGVRDRLVDLAVDPREPRSDLGSVPFASPTTVTVDVAKVPGEVNVANNHAEYNVIFSLPA